jgi:hypothetical protein
MADRPPPTALEDNASFARKFIGGTTNLAQRRRYQEDIEAARNERYDMQEMEFDRANRAAELADPLRARAIRATEQRLEYGADQFEAREDRLGKQLEEQKFSNDIRYNRQRSLDEQFRVKSTTEKLQSQHEANFFKGMADAAQQGLRPGSRAFASFVGELIDANYAAGDKLLTDALKTARIDGELSDVLSRKARMKEDGIDARLTLRVGPDGRESFTLAESAPPVAKPEKPVDPGAERGKMQAEYQRLENLFNKADGKRNPEIKAFFGGELNALREKMKTGPNLSGTAISAPTAPPAAPQVAAAAEAATPKLYTLTPDKKIQFNSKNFLASVQQALDDNLIDDATAIKLLDGAKNIKKKGQ